MPPERAAKQVPAKSFVNPATIIVVCALSLTVLGLSILFSASAWFKNKHGVAVPYLYLNKQAIGVLVAAGLCLIVSRVDLDYLRRYSWWIGGISLLLLTLVVIPPI